MDAMDKIRKTIRKAAPDAEETIKYGIPTFTLHGRNLIHFGAFKEHIGVYPVPRELREEAGPYLSGKSTLRCPLDEPLPLKLIEKIVKFRAAKLVAK